MLTAAPRHWYSWNYAVSRNHDHLADIDLSWWRERGTLVIDGQRFAVFRERLLSGRFILESHGAVVASAVKPGALRRRLLVEYAGTRYELRPRSLFTRTFELHAGDALIGSLSAPNLFSRRMNVDLPDTLPLPLRIFITWLTVILWKRDAEAAGA